MQRPHFAITPENANAVAAICRRLDGIPLAIELAAARVRSMSVEEVSQRLDQRFSLLTGGSHTAMPRHRRLRSLIDWSYDLLSGSEKVLLNRVAVFAGGCTLTDSEQVCSGEGIEARDVLDLLAALADKSLLIADEHDGASRYRMLETIRHYARDQLRDSGGETQVQRRHFHCFSALAHEFNASVGTPALPALLTRLDMEHDNVRAALAWSTTAGGDSAGGIVMASRLAWFWSFRGYLGEGSGWLSALLAIAPGEQDPEVRARSLVGAGVLAAQQGDDSAAEALYGESLAIFKKIGHRAGVAYALRSLGNVAFARGDFAAARALKEESLAILRELGDRRAIGELLGVIGEVAAEQGDYEGARAHLQECLASAREHGDQVRGAWALAGLGSVAYYEQDYPTAGEHLRQALSIIGDLGDHWGTASFLEKFAAVVAALGAPERAARIWGGVERLREEVGAPMPDSDRSRYDRQVEAGRAAMRDDAGFDEAWRAGRDLTAAQSVQYALETGAKGRDRSGTDSRRDDDPAASGTCAGTP